MDSAKKIDAGLTGTSRSSGWMSLSVVALVLVCLVFFPILTSSARSLNAGAMICVYIVLVTSYSLLISRAGIISFGHHMFFGIGIYGTALSLTHFGASWSAVAGGLVLSVLFAVVLAFVIAMFSLRLRTIFYAMMTFAFADAARTLITQSSAVTGGEDGMSYTVPWLISPGRKAFEIFGSDVSISGRLIAYYFVLAVALMAFMMMRHIITSPYGTVLAGIRENPVQAETIGYRVPVYRVSVSCVAAAFAVLAGVLSALWSGFASPNTSVNLHVMIDILLMLVIGGMRTIYGPILGAVIVVIAQNYLTSFLTSANAWTDGIPILSAALDPDRWQLWLGIAFVLTVYFFPSGILGWLQDRQKPRTSEA